MGATFSSPPFTSACCSGQVAGMTSPSVGSTGGTVDVASPPSVQVELVAGTGPGSSLVCFPNEGGWLETRDDASCPSIFLVMGGTGAGTIWSILPLLEWEDGTTPSLMWNWWEWLALLIATSWW